MTISSELTKVVYSTTDSVLIYAYTFRVDRAADFVIYLDDTLLVLTTDYSVDGLGNASGGNVTLVANPGASKRLTISRQSVIDQLVDYTAYDPFPAETHEGALDKLSMICQQLDEVLSRVLSYPIENIPLDSNLLPDYQASKLLAWDATEKKIVNSGAAQVSDIHITASQDNLDVSGVDVVWMDSVISPIDLRGLTGGVLNQVVRFVKTSILNSITIKHTQGVGDQDIYTPGAGTMTFLQYGGTEMICDGSNWFCIEQTQ